MINIRDLKIDALGKTINVTVSRPLGSIFSKIYLWTAETYKDYEKAIDLSSLILDIPGTEIYTFNITARKAEVKRFSGLYFVEFVTTKDGDEDDRNLGVAANLITYHECVLNKLVKTGINGCKSIAEDNCTNDAIYINTLITSVKDAIKFGYFEESIKIIESLNSLCETCQDCNDYGETLLIRGQAIGIEDGTIVEI